MFQVKLPSAGKSRKGFVACLLVLVLTGFFAGAPAATESKVWIVDPDPAVGDYNTIWEAVLFAGRGDTIHVNPGTYKESVEVVIPLTVEGSAEGDSILETKQDYGFKTTPAAAGATVRGFTVHCSSPRHRGILLDQAREVTVANNAISGCDAGVLLDRATENQILENILSDSTFGVYLDRSSQNKLLRNTGFGNLSAINLGQSIHNEIAQNTLSENAFGIQFWDGSDENTVEANILEKNGIGISLGQADRNILRSNEARKNGTGISLGRSMNNTLSYNLVIGNHFLGINLWKSSDNELTANTVQGNWEKGISLGNSSRNIIKSNDIRQNRGGGVAIGADTDKSKDNTIIENNISDNWWFGLANWTDSETTIDARENWWGDPSGPYQEEHNRSGKGNKIMGWKVLFEPWLGEPVEIPQPEGS